jgi:recombination protein RecA
MFSMALPAALLALHSRLRVIETPRVDALAFAWPELDAMLPDGGLPPGVTELASDGALGTSALAFAAVRAVHTRDARAWCAWVELGDSLHAPGAAQVGVDLARLLVVRPSSRDAARVSVRVASSGAFDLIVIDAFGFLQQPETARARGLSPDVIVRKLALSAESHGARVLLLSDSLLHRVMPWPVALRLAVERAPNELVVRVVKERHGRLGLASARVPLSTRPCRAG